MANAPGQIIKLGWDMPLDIDWDWQLPVLRQEIKRCAPGKSGALAQAFDNPDTAVVDKTGTVIDIEVGRHHRAWRYAAIQEHGGPAVSRTIYPVHAKALRFYYMGKLLFLKHVHMRAGQIKGIHYVQQGVYNWWNRLMRGTNGGPHWRSKDYRTRMATRGTVST